MPKAAVSVCRTGRKARSVLLCSSHDVLTSRLSPPPGRSRADRAEVMEVSVLHTVEEVPQSTPRISLKFIVNHLPSVSSWSECGWECRRSHNLGEQMTK